MIFILKPFHQLTVNELYGMMRLRQEVFIVEQNCPYLDADGKDQKSHHLFGYDDESGLMTYARLLPVGVSYPDAASIGRVASHPSVRGNGFGKKTMVEAIRRCGTLFGDKTPIKISAQSYLKKFYQDLGFEPFGEEYLEDNIPHIAMVITGLNK